MLTHSLKHAIKDGAVLVDVKPAQQAGVPHLVVRSDAAQKLDIVCRVELSELRRVGLSGTLQQQGRNKHASLLVCNSVLPKRSTVNTQESFEEAIFNVCPVVCTC